MDENASSVTDWFSSTLQSVGTQVANSWADSFSTKQLAPTVATPAPTSGGAIALKGALSNPLALLLLALGGFLVYKLAR